jgi:hypothetical protein
MRHHFGHCPLPDGALVSGLESVGCDQADRVETAVALDTKKESLVDIVPPLCIPCCHKSDDFKRVSVCFVIRRAHFVVAFDSTHVGEVSQRASAGYYDACAPLLGQCRLRRCTT